MLYVITAANEYTWHIGNEFGAVKPTDVIEIQADGAELDWIFSRITGLPRRDHARVQNWYGDHAKFIAKCLENPR